MHQKKTGWLQSWFGVQDMTVGRPMDSLVRFSIPLLVGNLAQQLYNTVDSIVVGQYIGDTALAAVGTAGPILNLLLVLFMGIATGASILSAQYFGAHDRETLSRVVGASILLTVISGLFMTFVGYSLSPWLMSLVSPPPDVLEGAVVYLQIIFIGILGGAAYNILAGVLRGLGDSLMPLISLLVASLLNIVLDILFVSQFRMGVAGVAWATIIAQAVSGVMCLVRLCRMRRVVDVNRQTLKPDWSIIRRLCSLGVPAGITQAIFSLSAIIVQSLTNSMGTSVIAASVAVMRVDGFAMMPNFTFGTATTTFTGQNIGAGRLDRVEKGTKDGLKLGLSVSVVLVALILFFGRYLMEMFTSTPEVIDTGMHMMRILAIGYIAMAVTQILSGVMRGAGDTMTPMWISLITTIVIRVPIAYGLAALMHSADALFISLLISWVMGAVLTSIAFRMGRWKKKSIINDDVPEPADVQV